MDPNCLDGQRGMDLVAEALDIENYWLLRSESNTI